MLLSSIQASLLLGVGFAPPRIEGRWSSSANLSGPVMYVSPHPRYHLKAVTNHSKLIYLLKPCFGNLDKREEMGSYCLELKTGAQQGHIGQIDHCVNFQDAKHSPSLSRLGAGALLG